MKIERVFPKPPPEFTMRFTQSEGWAIIGALRDYAANHRGAVERDQWLKWAEDLDRELRR